MNSIDEVNKSIKLHDFLTWLSSGASAVSLALLLFIQSSSLQGLEGSFLFVVSIPFLVCASAISGTVKAKNITTDTVDNIHTVVISIGSSSFVCGLSVLLYSLNHKFLWLFLVAVAISVFLFFWCAHIINEKASHK